MGDEGEGGHEEEVLPGCTPKQASAFRKGGYIILRGKPCKVMEMSTSKTGKHGHAKVNFTGIDIFTGKKYQMIQGSTHNMLEYVPAKSEYSVMSCDDSNMTLLDEKGNTKEDVPPPTDEEMRAKIVEAVDAGEKEVMVVVLEAVGHVQVMSYTVKDYDDKK